MDSLFARGNELKLNRRWRRNSTRCQVRQKRECWEFCTTALLPESYIYGFLTYVQCQSFNVIVSAKHILAQSGFTSSGDAGEVEPYFLIPVSDKHLCDCERSPQKWRELAFL